MNSCSNNSSKERIKQIRQFVDQHLIPLEHDFLHHDWEQLSPLLDDKRKLVKSLGLWAPNLPTPLGGLELSLVELALVYEELGRTPIGHYVFGCQAPDAGNAELLLICGSEQQKKDYLHPLAEGKYRSCFAMTEPDTAGSNPTLLATTAQETKDSYIINGRKWFTSSADGADFVIVMAVTNNESNKHQRASLFILSSDTPGFKIIRNISVMGHTGGGYFSHAEVVFENCKVSKDQLLGNEGEGFKLAQQRLGPGRIQHCMRWLGICQRALDTLTQYSLTRKTSTHSYLADQQIIQSWIADSAAELQAARAFVLQTAQQAQAQGFQSARNHIAMIKYFTADILQRILDRSIQAHGALGVTDDTILAFFYRQERAARIYDGPDEVHKLQVARYLIKQAQNPLDQNIN